MMVPDSLCLSTQVFFIINSASTPYFKNGLFADYAEVSGPFIPVLRVKMSPSSLDEQNHSENFLNQERSYLAHLRPKFIIVASNSLAC